MTDILTKYNDLYPDVELLIETGMGETLVNRVLDYNLDITLFLGEVEHPELETSHLYDEELVLVCQAGRDLDEMLRTRTIMKFGEGCVFRSRFEYLLREKGIIPKRRMEFTAFDGMLGCVRAGIGVTLLSGSLVKTLASDVSDLAIHPVPEHLSRAPVTYVRRADSVRTRSESCFLQTAKKAFER
jgi:DNA-binding transcriptional LysR family regulator